MMPRSSWPSRNRRQSRSKAVALDETALMEVADCLAHELSYRVNDHKLEVTSI
ncbi:hypothetical protein DFAR_2740009 [Desulfarculales bacterium]